jgi:leucine-rich repeat protein SHOC2
MIKHYLNISILLLLFSCGTTEIKDNSTTLNTKDSLLNERFDVGSADSLNLSDLKLAAIPEIPGALLHLRSFNLSSNELKALYDSLYVLTELKNLDASFNQIEDIEFKNLNNPLEYLNLNSNKITTFPTSVLNLAKLKELDLGENYIDSLPSDLSSLSSLKTLSLNDYDYPNSHKKVNPSLEISKITTLKALESLAVRWRFNTVIPGNIGELKNIKTLLLIGGSYTKLPASLFELTDLQELYLSRNQLTTIPADINKLKHLKTLNLSNNLLTGIPKEIALLTELKELNLDDNPIKSLPESIKSLKLESLSLIHTAIPEEEKIKIKKLLVDTNVIFE